MGVKSAIKKAIMGPVGTHALGRFFEKRDF
jgi:hypothetical protein